MTKNDSPKHVLAQSDQRQEKGTKSSDRHEQKLANHRQCHQRFRWRYRHRRWRLDVRPQGGQSALKRLLVQIPE